MHCASCHTDVPTVVHGALTALLDDLTGALPDTFVEGMADAEQAHTVDMIAADDPDGFDADDNAVYCASCVAKLIVSGVRNVRYHDGTEV